METKKHCKTACLLSPEKKWGDPFNLVWLPSRSTMWNCFGWLQQGPLLTSASPLCVHPCKHCDYCSTHEQVREQPAARQQLMQRQIAKFWDDSLLLGYETRMPSTLHSDSHQGGISAATWESPAISTCWWMTSWMTAQAEWHDINRKMLMVRIPFHHGQIPRSHYCSLPGAAVITRTHKVFILKSLTTLPSEIPSS